ncbi:MAG: sugar ABC transporter ATP-binding protein, partial [Methylobacteriaceae bacterium]|nr:sugar ABC transporter ATP-binding protein [Methylobacteriaceae bacterium]
TGAVRPDAGEIEIRGNRIEPGSPARMIEAGVACIYQHANLVPAMTVLDNIFLGRQPTHALGLVNAREQRAQAERLLGGYEIDLPLDTVVGDLPTVKQKEVEIAKALSLDAKVLLMDEPTAWLSLHEVKNLFRTIESLKERRVAILYISHVLDEIYEVAQDVTILRDGRVVAACPVGHIDRPELLRRLVGEKLAREVATHSAGDVNESRRGEACLVCEGLTRTGVFHEVSFALHAGEILCITGVVGSKRTELVRALCGADRLDSGRMILNGRAFAPKNPRDAIERGVAFVPEDRHHDGLMLQMSVEDNLVMAMLASVSRHGVLQRRKKAAHTMQQISRLGIKPASPRYRVGKLSGGNQQKVLIGKWLQRGTRVLILDEPTVGIDVGAKSEIYSILKSLKQEGAAILIVSSDIEEVMAIADRVMVMRAGRVHGFYDTARLTEPELISHIAGE